MTVQHVVLFRFPRSLTALEYHEALTQLRSWPDGIGEFEKIHFGPDLNGGERAQGYQYLLLTEHADLASLRRYQDHPLHQQFGAWTKLHKGEVLGFDYELDDTTVVLRR